MAGALTASTAFSSPLARARVGGVFWGLTFIRLCWIALACFQQQDMLSKVCMLGGGVLQMVLDEMQKITCVQNEMSGGESG